MRPQHVVVGLAALFVTWLALGSTAALLGIPNFAAKLEGQECLCTIDQLLGSLDIHIEVGNLLISAWILIPTLVFSALAMGALLSRPPWILDRRRYVRGLRKAAAVGGGVALLVAAAIALEATLTNKIVIYPADGAAPNFEFQLLNGTRVNLYQFRGNPILLEFMWTRCPHCIDQVRMLREVQAALGDRVLIISIAVTWGGDSLQDLRRFHEKYGATWLGGLDMGEGTDRYRIREVPTILILDRGLKVRAKYVGLVPSELLISDLKEVL